MSPCSIRALLLLGDATSGEERGVFVKALFSLCKVFAFCNQAHRFERTIQHAWESAGENRQPHEGACA